MRLNQRRTVQGEAEDEALAEVVGEAGASAVAVAEDVRAAVAEDAKGAAVVVAMIIKAMPGSPESHAGSLSTTRAIRQ
jgi:hypothetical protein